MTKFTFSGHLNKDASQEFHLTLPRAKHFELKYIHDGEKDLQIHKLVSKALYRGLINHKIPIVGILGKEEHNSTVIYNTNVPRTLRNILLQSPFPLSQGPVIPQLDCATDERRSEAEIMESKTIFTHEESQQCFAWHPKQSGISSWGENGYEVNQTEFHIHGAASLLDKKMLYTCSFSKCIIYCPCSLCGHGRQCGDHFLLLP